MVMDPKSKSIHAVSMAILKPKMYATMDQDGRVSAKGLSIVRRDRTQMQSMIQRAALTVLLNVKSLGETEMVEAALAMYRLELSMRGAIADGGYRYSALGSRGRIRVSGDTGGDNSHYWESVLYNNATGDTLKDLAVAGLVVDTDYYNKIANATVQEMMKCLSSDPVGVLETARRSLINTYLN